jgi:hypothetical protein
MPCSYKTIVYTESGRERERERGRELKAKEKPLSKMCVL